jgi:pilus assembly protein FimV
MFRKSILASTLSLLLLPSGAWALGLGGMRPESSLNQPFVGEIDLLGANPDQLDSVKVVLAPEAEFAKRGTERQHFLTKLRFKPQVSARGKMVVRVTSTEPIREPYMDFLVEVIWPKGRLVKGYTVLLDPPVTARRSPPPAEPPVARSSVAESAATRAQAPTTAPAVAPPARSAVQPVASAGAAPDSPLRYGPIKPGTGLWHAARQMVPAGATIHQTAMALYRNNQQAFVRGNINKLRQGRVLQIPTSAEVFAMDAGTAEREFRSALSGKRVTAKPLTDVSAAAPEAESRLKIAGAAKPAESHTAPAEGQSTAPSGGPAAPDIEQELLLVRETGESTRQETDELRERVHQLESSLADIQQLLTLRDAELARLQSGQAVAPVPSDLAPSGMVPSEAQAPRDLGIGQTVAAEGQEQVAPIVSAGETAAVVEPQPAASVESPPASGADPAEPQLTHGVTAGDGDATLPQGRAASDVAVTSPVASTSAGSEESGPSWLDSVPLVGGALKAVPAPVLWSGLVAVPLLGLWWLSMRRRRSEEDLAEFALATHMTPDHELASAAESGTETTRAFRGLELDEPSSPEAAEAGHLGLASLEEEGEAADVISEADIYIAYGRYRDAEDLLKQAIARFPRRADLRYRLADVYVGARNDEGLATLVSEMKQAGMDQEDPEHWGRLIGQAKLPAERPTAPAVSGAAAAAVAPVSALGIGGLASHGASQGGASATRGLEGTPGTNGEQGYFVPPVGNVDSFAPDGADSLVMDFSRHQEPSLGLETLDLGPLVTTGEPEATERQPNSAQGSARKGDVHTDMELDMSDLTPATEFDLAELGFVAPTPAVPPGGTADSPKRPPLLDSEQWLNVEPIIGLDTMPSVEADEGTPPGTEDLAQAWAEPVRYPSGPMRGPGGAPEADRLKLESNEQEIASSELFSSEWHMDGGVWDEAATKLDLGRAYVEMDDRQAAEALLLEVAEEGNPDQQAEARELLARMKPN